ncbi:mitochondrial import inner membrane translocase subunit Tim21 isoform X2 [Lycorma delicatula]|uniref:mitochondrial import inner membrane translocase subunit Tim21 isoform X2 n=1 Tax=Lycorma delicatula TaxID=130591 RepID=UPI003F514CDC
MAKLLPLARKTSPLGIHRGILYVAHFLGTKSTLIYNGFSTKNDIDDSNIDSKSMSVRQSGSEVQTTFSKMKETTKTASYMGVIIAGVGITAVIFYTVLKELFSSKSPNNIYSKALERCRNDPNVQNALGEPIKGFGEETRRGRRRHVSHVVYMKDGVEHLRMKFYIEGLRSKATVFLEMKEDIFGNYMYRYLFVEPADLGKAPIVLEDNRYGYGDLSKVKQMEQCFLE